VICRLSGSIDTLVDHLRGNPTVPNNAPYEGALVTYWLNALKALIVLSDWALSSCISSSFGHMYMPNFGLIDEYNLALPRFHIEDMWLESSSRPWCFVCRGYVSRESFSPWCFVCRISDQR
jgi:hypothetical protein